MDRYDLKVKYSESECMDCVENGAWVKYEDVIYEIDQAKSEVDELEMLILKTRSALKELYAIRGEDKVVAAACNQFFDQAEDY